MSAANDDAQERLTLRSEDLEWREIDHEIVALDIRTASYLTVNGSGALLWRLLAEGATLPDLVNALLDVYEVEAVTAARDASDFLASLAAQSLLTE